MSAKQKDVGSSPAHDQKFFCRVFRLCETFFANFLMSPKSLPFIFFLFCKRTDVQKLPKGPFYIFRHYATYRRPEKIGFFQFFPHVGTVEENT